MTPRQLRLLRAASASTVASLLAAVSHTLGGGAAPAPLLVIALSVFLTPLAVVLIGTGSRRIRVAATVGVSQGLFHTVFLLLGAPTGSALPGAHSHHLDLTLLGPIAPVTLPDAAMFGAHVIAAVLTTAVIWHGEQLLREVVRWVQAVVRRVVAFTPAGHERPLALHSTLRLAFDPCISVVVSRRGPPAFSRG